MGISLTHLNQAVGGRGTGARPVREVGEGRHVAQLLPELWEWGCQGTLSTVTIIAGNRTTVSHCAVLCYIVKRHVYNVAERIHHVVSIPTPSLYPPPPTPFPLPDAPQDSSAPKGVYRVKLIAELSQTTEEEVVPLIVQVISPPFLGRIVLSAGPAKFGMDLTKQENGVRSLSWH